MPHRYTPECRERAAKIHRELSDLADWLKLHHPDRHTLSEYRQVKARAEALRQELTLLILPRE